MKTMTTRTNDQQPQSSGTSSLLNKVPEVTLVFWVVKILSTTVGETAADYLAVDVGWGLLETTVVMAGLLGLALLLQLSQRRHVPWMYWLTVVLVSIVGTQITDALTDLMQVSLYTSTALFGLLLVFVFVVWQHTEHSLSIRSIDTRRRELFYWLAILCTFALGTAAGDLANEALQLGFTIGVIGFGALIVAIMLAWRGGMHPVLAFWLAYILTRPFGASLGDLLTQPVQDGGLGLGTFTISAIFLAVIVVLVARLQLASSSRPGAAA